jgi:hypothetical protein
MSYPLGNFSSTGIDDNATSTAITIDANNSVYPVGNSNTPWSNTTGDGTIKFQSGSVNSGYDTCIAMSSDKANGYALAYFNQIGTPNDKRYLAFNHNGSQKATIERSSGGNGVNYFTGTDGAVYLGGSANANALDDYEEGTHDVTLTASSSGSWTARTGFSTLRYTKIGGTLVHITGQVECLGSSSPSGELRVSLPFTIRSNNDSRLKVSVAMDGIGAHSFRTFAYFSYGNSYFTIRKYHDDGSTGNLDNGDLDSAWEFHISATYRT